VAIEKSRDKLVTPDQRTCYMITRVFGSNYVLQERRKCFTDTELTLSSNFHCSVKIRIGRQFQEVELADGEYIYTYELTKNFIWLARAVLTVFDWNFILAYLRWIILEIMWLSHHYYCKIHSLPLISGSLQMWACRLVSADLRLGIDSKNSITYG